ncbi:MAG: response regulator [Verrucomicrobiales bacterium]
MLHNENRHFILFAEDEPDQVDILRIACKQAGIPETDFLIARDGLEILLYLELAEQPNSTSRLPTILVLDFRLPVMDGLEILSWVRNNEKFKQLPVYLFTSGPTPETRSRAAALHCTAILEKYEQISKLIELLRSLHNQPLLVA